ncbi:MAG: phosphoglycerate kinase [Bacteroidetes bacterium]|nr:phosphoglycerate kinase [Bacteroidota bacterium]HET6244500.1 phosphoglycerate kinase [Bacteroidia bacterium]
MKNIDEANFKGKKVLLRVDFNVPFNEMQEITDDTRIRKTIPTIRKIIRDGGSVIIMTHLGKPEGEFKEELSLTNVLPVLSELLKLEVLFADDCIGNQAVSLSRGLKKGEVLLLENLRFHKEEEEGSEDFARKLASLGDVYVNDAFGAAHRPHASVSVLPQFIKERYAGILFLKELEKINKIMENQQKPFIAIIGGAKVSDKIKVIEVLLDKVDYLLIGGAMAYTFVKAKGGDIGSSIYEKDALDKALALLEKAKQNNVKIMLPLDSMIVDMDEANDPEDSQTDQIPEHFKGMDIGFEARGMFEDIIDNSKTILWNGPMGVFEINEFEGGTKAIAKAIANATRNGAFSLIGGGETSAAVKKFGLTDQFSHVSTGGGALLKYIEGKQFPAIKALEEVHAYAEQNK